MSKRRKAARERGRQRQPRRQGTRELRKRFLIVCEGEKTEPNYFLGFRVPKDVCEIVGLGDNTINLVREAEKLSRSGQYDQVWVVMDKDDFPVQNFNNALSFAREKNIQVAYSNEAFELWYLLHFAYHNTAISRRTYQERLTQQLNIPYKKNSSQMYALLEGQQEVAVQNAERLLEGYGNDHRPAYDNPSTTVHHLVSELRKHAR